MTFDKVHLLFRIRIRIHNLKLQIRIRILQKFRILTDPDSDPQHCLLVSTLNIITLQLQVSTESHHYWLESLALVATAEELVCRAGGGDDENGGGGGSRGGQGNGGGQQAEL
jgi:hypothetical protein